MKQGKKQRTRISLWSRIDGLQRKIADWLSRKSSKLSSGTIKLLLIMFLIPSVGFCVWLVLGQGRKVDFKGMENVSYMRLKVIPDEREKPDWVDTGRTK